MVSIYHRRFLKFPIFFQTEKGYGFEFIMNYDDRPEVQYQYEIVKTSSRFYERRKTGAIFSNNNNNESLQVK